MSALCVEVTAERIAAAGDLHKGWHEPVSTALAELTGQDVDVDGDGNGGYIATIGQDAWTLVIDLPETVNDFLDYRWENGGPGDPFTFEIEVPAWVPALIAKAGDYVSPGA